MRVVLSLARRLLRFVFETAYLLFGASSFKAAAATSGVLACFRKITRFSEFSLTIRQQKALIRSDTTAYFTTLVF